MHPENLNDFPTRTRDHVYESESYAAISRFFKDPYFILRQYTERDYGFDLIIEVLYEGNPSNWTTVIQVKSIGNGVKLDGSISRSVGRINLAYMLSSAQSLYLIYHRTTDKIWYRFAHQVLRDCCVKKGTKWIVQDSVTVRCYDSIDDSSIVDLHRVLVDRFSREKAARTRYPDYDSFLRQIEDFPDGQPPPVEAIETLARETLTHLTRGQRSASEAKYTVAVERLDDAHRLAMGTGDRLLRARTELALGGVLVFLGQFSRGEQFLTSAVAILSTEDDNDSRIYLANAYGNLAVLQQYMGRLEKSRTFLGQAIVILEDLGGEMRTLIRLRLMLAANILQCGEVADVESDLLAIFDYANQLDPGDAAPIYAAIWGMYGTVQQNIWRSSSDAEDLRTARTYFMRALSVSESWKLFELALSCKHSLAQCSWFEGDLASECKRAICSRRFAGR